MEETMPVQSIKEYHREIDLENMDRRIRGLEEYVDKLKREDLRIARALLEAFGPDALSEEQKRIVADSTSGLPTPAPEGGSGCP